MSTTLKWDAVEDRTYEQGLDRVAIYLNDGTAVAWSGVVSIEENANRSSDSTYFEGTKANTLVETDAFSGSISAITYPDVIQKLEGGEAINHGIYLTDQHLQAFSMSFRTGVGSALEGSLKSYKIHILFGLTLIPNSRPHTTLNDSTDIELFEWDMFSVPAVVGDYRPTSHIILDEDKIPPALKTALNNALYGDGVNPPEFTNIEDLIEQILAYSFWRFEDNGDGTFDGTPFDPLDLHAVDPGAVFPHVNNELFDLYNVDLEDLGNGEYLLVNGYGTTLGCSPRLVGGTAGQGGDCYHLVESALASNGLSHYIGTAPLGSYPEQSTWRVTQIFFGPPVTTHVRTNIPWTSREL